MQITLGYQRYIELVYRHSTLINPSDTVYQEIWPFLRYTSENPNLTVSRTKTRHGDKYISNEKQIIFI